MRATTAAAFCVGFSHGACGRVIPLSPWGSLWFGKAWYPEPEPIPLDIKIVLVVIVCSITCF